MEKIYTIIIAAGKGTRMNSAHSKLIQKLYGKELVKRVQETASKIRIRRDNYSSRIQKRRNKKCIRKYNKICRAKRTFRNRTCCYASNASIRR